MDKKLMGKNSRKQGKVFELKVRHDLVSKGWIVCKWSNNVEDGKLISARHIFNSFTKAMSAGNGFPDFIAFRYSPDAGEQGYNFKKDFPNITGEDGEDWSEFYARYINIAVESKMNGKLDKIEKEKCNWLLRNNIFSKILIASKGDREIIYTEWKS